MLSARSFYLLGDAVSVEGPLRSGRGQQAQRGAREDRVRQPARAVLGRRRPVRAEQRQHRRPADERDHERPGGFPHQEGALDRNLHAARRGEQDVLRRADLRATCSPGRTARVCSPGTSGCRAAWRTRRSSSIRSPAWRPGVTREVFPILPEEPTRRAAQGRQALRCGRARLELAGDPSRRARQPVPLRPRCRRRLGLAAAGKDEK